MCTADVAVPCLAQVTVLGGRYVLHCMLGRGGFSEVYKARASRSDRALLFSEYAIHQAYDADELRYVACKVHQLVPQWSEDHKRSYVRHAVRLQALHAT
jgi:tousled-like kinase